jgi:FAD/FMN-containing dehydrogenase
MFSLALAFAFVVAQVAAQNASELRAALGRTNIAPSDIFYPDQLGYDAAVNDYNLRVPVKPAALVRPRDASQVAAAVNASRDTGFKVQPKSGGHSYANYGLGGVDGAVALDLTYLQTFEMNNTNWQATVGGGTLLGDLTTRLHDNGGRAMAHGTCPQVGIGGKSSPSSEAVWPGPRPPQFPS